MCNKDIRGEEKREKASKQLSSEQRKKIEQLYDKYRELMDLLKDK